LDISLVILVQFILEVCAAAKNNKKSLQPFIFLVQGHSSLSMLTSLRGLSLILVMISSMSVPICNSFYAIQANSGKIATF